MPETDDQKLEIIDQFTRQAAGYAQLTQRLATERRSPVLDAALPRGDDVALDVCCGAGGLTLALAPHVLNIIGIDVTAAMLDQARVAERAAEVMNVEWRLGSSDCLPFADGAFTLVTSSAAFHHLVRPAETLAEMARVCAPGGRVVLMDFGFEDPAKARVFDDTETLRDPSHVRAFTLPELLDLADGLPLRAHSAVTLPVSDIPFEMVLATSHPTTCTIDHVRKRVRADADAGDDRHGLNARIVDGALIVSYPQALIVWERAEA